MYIRRYGERPGLYVPDEGEIVLAARSASGPFVRAVVTKVRRSQADTVRINFTWLDDSRPTVDTEGVEAGTDGHVTVSTDGAAPALIRRIPSRRDTDSKV